MTRPPRARGPFWPGLVLVACIAAIAYLCAGCAVACKYPPDEGPCKTGPWVCHYEAPLPDGGGVKVCPLVDRIDNAGLQLCPSKRHRLVGAYNSLRIEVYGYALWCGGRLVKGCQDGSDIRVQDARAAQDEVGHVVWETCYGNSGEYFDGGYSPAFAHWLGTARG